MVSCFLARDWAYTYLYTYIYIYTYVCVYYIYIYIDPGIIGMWLCDFGKLKYRCFSCDFSSAGGSKKLAFFQVKRFQTRFVTEHIPPGKDRWLATPIYCE